MLTRTPIVAGRVGPAILAAAFAAILLGCAATPTPPPGPPGRIVVSLVPAPPANPLPVLAPVHRAHVVSADRTIDVGWRILEGEAPVEVPSGKYRFEAFTVFLSDYIVCADANGVIGEPGSTGAPGATCLQPTLGPSQVCALDLDVPPGGDVSLVYRELDEGRCELTSASPSPT